MTPPDLRSNSFLQLTYAVFRCIWPTDGLHAILKDKPGSRRRSAADLISAGKKKSNLAGGLK